MIIGTGIDIVDISRMEESISRHGQRFMNRLFTPSEQNYCQGKVSKYQHYSARFAGKEAFLKAAGTGLRDGIHWLDMEFINDTLGKPEAHYTGKLADHLIQIHVDRVHVSFSHTGTHAVAVVILERSE
jgi:holo-[acyl-carrier protein] synthase